MGDIIICRIDGCENPVRVFKSQLCNVHWLRLKRHGDPLGGSPRRSKGRVCMIDGCGKKHKGRGYCATHFARFKKYGDPNAYHEDYRRCERWIDEHKLYKGEDCIKWPFGSSDSGRGVIGRGKGPRSAPRAMCIAAHGEPTTPGHQAAHSCGNGHLGCMNPNHLRWATHMENVVDRADHGRDRVGTQINTNKLTEDQVREIRGLRGVMSGRDIAVKFCVSPSNISDIQNRKSWAWLE